MIAKTMTLSIPLRLNDDGSQEPMLVSLAHNQKEIHALAIVANLSPVCWISYELVRKLHLLPQNLETDPRGNLTPRYLVDITIPSPVGRALRIRQMKVFLDPRENFPYITLGAGVCEPFITIPPLSKK